MKRGWSTYSWLLAVFGLALSSGARAQERVDSVHPALSGDTTLVHVWQPQYRLHIETNGQGGIAGSDVALHNDGSEPVLQALPAAYQSFAGWSGDTEGCTISGDQITVVMVRSRLVVATFVPTLAPNGTPHEWLADHGLTNGELDFAAAELDDFDKDGYPSGLEFIADTNPRDPLDFFPRLAPLLRQENPLGLLIDPTSTSRLYEVLWSPDIRNRPQSWLPYGTSHYGSGTGLVFDVTNQAPTGIFRSRVRLP